MLNEVQIEGLVAREAWTYDKDLFFRIASYRDADMPIKPDVVPGRDEPDYVNVRVPGGATSLVSPRKGMRVRVHGYLQSRDFKESMAEFIEKVRKAGSNSELPAIPDAEKIRIDRGVTEVVALRVVAMDESARRRASAAVEK